MGFVKVLLAIFLGLFGLLMTSCGLIFTVGSGGQGVLMLSVPALLIGLALLYFAWRLVKGKSSPLPPARE